METDEGLYQASPQTKGKLAHEPVDSKTSSNRNDDIFALPVFSEQLGLMGKIDVYKRKEKKLIERKYQLKQIFQGQIFSFYEISTNKMMPISIAPSSLLIVSMREI